jgi:hypothetical protein
MALLRHEARRYAVSGGMWFGRATLKDAALLEQIDGPCDVLYVVYASTQEGAMQAHYDRQGWGAYRPAPGRPLRPYERAALARQLQDYPEDRELRRINGVDPEGRQAVVTPPPDTSTPLPDSATRPRP